MPPMIKIAGQQPRPMTAAEEAVHVKPPEPEAPERQAIRRIADELPAPAKAAVLAILNRP